MQSWACLLLLLDGQESRAFARLCICFVLQFFSRGVANRLHVLVRFCLPCPAFANAERLCVCMLHAFREVWRIACMRVLPRFGLPCLGLPMQNDIWCVCVCVLFHIFREVWRIVSMYLHASVCLVGLCQCRARSIEPGCAYSYSCLGGVRPCARGLFSFVPEKSPPHEKTRSIVFLDTAASWAGLLLLSLYFFNVSKRAYIVAVAKSSRWSYNTPPTAALVVNTVVLAVVVETVAILSFIARPRADTVRLA